MQRKKIPKSKEKIDVIISSQEIGENASLPMVINPTVINSTEVSGPTRVSGVYLLRNQFVLVHRLGVRETKILDVFGGFFLWVLHEVELDVEENKKKIDMLISGQEMRGNASLPTVINPTVINYTEVSGPT